MRSRPSTNDVCCQKCGSTKLEVEVFSETREFRGLLLDVGGLQATRCGNCGSDFETDSQKANNYEILKTEFQIVRDRTREKEGLLSGSEIAGIRNRLSLSQKEAAAVFGGGVNAFNKYESGEVLQSYAMDRLLRVSDAIGISAVNFLNSIAKNPRYTYNQLVPIAGSIFSLENAMADIDTSAVVVFNKVTPQKLYGLYKIYYPKPKRFAELDLDFSKDQERIPELPINISFESSFFQQ